MVVVLCSGLAPPQMRQGMIAQMLTITAFIRSNPGWMSALP